MLDGFKEHISGEIGGLQTTLEDKIEGSRQQLQGSINRIEAQTTKTNGRVSNLEESRTQIWTALKVAGVLMVIVILPLVALLWKAYVKRAPISDADLDTRITQAVQKALPNK